MSSYVAIANLAAIAVGTSARLTAPGDNTVLGRAVAAVWDISRRAALQDGWLQDLKIFSPKLVERMQDYVKNPVI